MWHAPKAVDRPMFDFSVYQSIDTLISVLDCDGVSYTVGFGHGLISASSLCGMPGDSDCRGISHTYDIDAPSRRMKQEWGGQLYIQQIGRATRK